MTGHRPGRKEPGGSGSPIPWPHRSFLGSLTSGDRKELLNLGTRHVYPRHAPILRQGDEGKFVVLILNGIVKIRIAAETGTEILAGIRGAGDLIGEMAPISGESRSASATAATRVDVRLIGAGAFLGYLGRSPGVASRLAQMVADRLRAANRRSLEFSSYTAEGRIARVLSEVALAHGHPEGTALRIGSEITQADIASLSVASLSTVEKALQAFEQEGLVIRKRRNLIVLDPATLVAKTEDLPIIPYWAGLPVRGARQAWTMSSAAGPGR
jgi:CRP/FNR family cyclic AMP-dependent transcriptional regulator